MVILDGSEKFFYVELPKGTRAAQTIPDLHACVAFIDTARRLGCAGFVVQEPGQRSTKHFMQAVLAAIKVDPLLLGLRGIGNVAGGKDIQVLNVGGRNLTIRKVRKTGGGLLLPV